jgi:hypothetical protein
VLVNFKKEKPVILKHCPVLPYFDDVFPSRNAIPEWYKQAKLSLNDAPTPLTKTHTFKRCVPFLEAMTFGYVIPLPIDIVVTQIDGFAYFEWPDKGKNDPVQIRKPSIMQGFPVPDGYEETYPVWTTGSLLEIPKGYSALLTHPLNRYELPFLTLGGIVDSGVLFDGNIPFFIKKGFEGIIPHGTPILQVLPFKTDSWELEKDETLREKAELNLNKRRITAFSWYKNNIWVKKSFN